MAAVLYRQVALIRGDERDLALAWAWLEARDSGTALDVGELVGEAGGDGADAPGANWG